MTRILVSVTHSPERCQREAVCERCGETVFTMTDEYLYRFRRHVIPQMWVGHDCPEVKDDED